MRMSPYVMFDGNCEAAFTYYAACGLGRVVSLMRQGDTPMAGSPAVANRIMHGEFEGDGVHFFGADAPQPETIRGIWLMLEIPALAEANRVFAALGDGGSVVQAMEKQLSGPTNYAENRR